MISTTTKLKVRVRTCDNCDNMQFVFVTSRLLRRRCNLTMRIIEDEARNAVCDNHSFLKIPMLKGGAQ